MAVAAEDQGYSSLSVIAMRVAVAAAELAARVRASAVADVDTKSSETDVVTAGDKAAERLVRDELARLRPGEVVLGEEAGASGAPEPGAVCWVVDPIDGTVNYLYGFPWFAVSVAAQIDGRSVAGAVVEPVSAAQAEPVNRRPPYHAPPPRVAVHSAPVAALITTPATASPATSAASETANCGIP